MQVHIINTRPEHQLEFHRDPVVYLNGIELRLKNKRVEIYQRDNSDVEGYDLHITNVAGEKAHLPSTNHYNSRGVRVTTLSITRETMEAIYFAIHALKQNEIEQLTP